jgi:hypothetical protein
VKSVDPPEVPKQNVLLYGAPKTGKTLGAASAPGPVAYGNFDLPNATWLAHQKFGDKLVEFAYESFMDTIIVLQQWATSGRAELGGKTIETVVLDPINEMYRQLLEELSDRAVSPSLPTYMAVQTHIERTCRALCASPAFNTVLVLHDIPVKDEASGEVERLPGTGTTNPALGRKLMSMVDVIGFTAELDTSSGRQFVAQLVDQKGRRGGDRFDVLGEYRETNLTEWFELGPTMKTNEKETKDA